jgi:hypothetical protein
VTAADIEAFIRYMNAIAGGGNAGTGGIGTAGVEGAVGLAEGRQ